MGGLFLYSLFDLPVWFFNTKIIGPNSSASCLRSLLTFWRALYCGCIAGINMVWGHSEVFKLSHIQTGQLFFSPNSFKVVWWQPKHEDKALCLCQNHSFLSGKNVLAAVWSRCWTRSTNKNKQLLNNQEATTTNTCGRCQHLQPASKTKTGILISSLLMLAGHPGYLPKSSSSSQKKLFIFMKCLSMPFTVLLEF